MLFETMEAPPTQADMKRVLLSDCLIGRCRLRAHQPAYYSCIKPWGWRRDEQCDALVTPLRSIDRTRSEHAVVVDMPKVIWLSHAFPDKWDQLPISFPPYEQPPATDQRSSWP